MLSCFSSIGISFFLLQIKVLFSRVSSVEFPITFNQYKLSSNDSKPLIITGTIPFCIGTPFQCFNMMVDTMTSYSWVNNYLHKEYFNNSYSSETSSSIEILEQSFSLLFSGAYCSGNYIREIVSPLNKAKLNENDLMKMVLGLVNKSEIKQKIITRDGTLGLIKSYQFDKRVNSSFNYLDYLKDNDIITQRVVSFEFNDLTQGTITFGISPKNVKHKCGKDVKVYSFSWACYLYDFSFGKEKIDTPNELVMFDSILQMIFAPYEGGFFILNNFVKLSNNQCSIHSEADESIFFLQCNINVDISVFEDIKFNFGESKFIIYSKDLFVIPPSQKEQVCLIKVKRNERTLWTFGLPAFKYKIISLNQDEMSIGFQDHRATIQSKVWLFVLSPIVIIIVLVVCMLVYIRRKRLLNHLQTEIDFSLVK